MQAEAAKAVARGFLTSFPKTNVQGGLFRSCQLKRLAYRLIRYSLNEESANRVLLGL